MYTRSFREIAESDRQDAVSDILLKVFKNLYTYKPLYSVSTWVYRIARNHLIDLYRRNRKNPIVSIEEMPEQTAISEASAIRFVDEFVRNDSIGQCRQCIKSLDKKNQRIVFFRHYEGLASKEIALIEGMSHNTVRQRLTFIRRHIRKLLGDGYEY